MHIGPLAAGATSNFIACKHYTSVTMLCSATARAYSSGTCQRPAAACRPTSRGTVVTRATPRQQHLQKYHLQQQLQFEQDKATWFTSESRWRLFGFGATACSQKHCRSVKGTEYVSMAAYDLVSGELFNIVINPKLHDPGYRLLPSRLRGLSKEEVLSEGVHVLAAFDQLVDFVHTNTPPGQTPVIMGHEGFELLFKHVEQCLQRAAAATAAQAGPTCSSTSVIDHGTAASNSTGSSSGTWRRRRSALQPLVKADLSAPGSSSSSKISSKGHQHSSWPQEWMFFDTYIMAETLLALLSSQQHLLNVDVSDVNSVGKGTLQQKLHHGLHKKNCRSGSHTPRDDSLGALDALLLPQRQHSAGPRDIALQAAVNTARLAQLLLVLMQDVPGELSSSQPRSRKGRLSTKEALAVYALKQWQHYTPWVCQPYCLNPADHRQGRFHNAAVVYYSSYSCLEHIPSSMVLARRKAAQAVYAARKAPSPASLEYSFKTLNYDLLTYYFRHLASC